MNTHTHPALRLEGSAGCDAALLAQPAKGSGVKNQIDVQFEAGPDAAAAARNALIALDGRVDDALLNDVRLLVSELITNSVRHSSVQSHDTVHMTVTVTESTLRVEVADPGEGFEPRPRDADRTRPGGWGLYLVDQLADRWGVARDQLTRVWFEMDQGRPRAHEHAAA
jgi:anti-sigma regulatory factor (Ser/Thr protein kinase)